MKGTVYTLHAHGVRQQAARGGRVRRFPAILGKCMMAFLLVCFLTCQPYVVALEGDGLQVKKQTAQAVPAAVPVALEFLEAMAAAAGLSVSDFMLTCGISVAAVSGFNMLEQAANYGATGTIDGLWRLTSTANWPAWDELTDTEKSDYGSEANYTAAQFNSALSVFGPLADTRDSYYDHGGFGGGTFDEGSQSLLTQMGDIAKDWMAGRMVSLAEVQQVASNPSSIFAAQGVQDGRITTSLGVQMAKTSDMYSQEVSYSYTDAVYAGYITTNSAKPWLNVGWFMEPTGYVTSVKNNVNGAQNRWTIFASKEPMTLLQGQKSGKEPEYVTPGTSQLTMSHEVINDKDVYYTYTNFIPENPQYLTCASWTNTTDDRLVQNSKYIAYVMLYGQTIYDSMPDYRSTDGKPDFPGDEVGAKGLSPSTTWPSLFGESYTPTPNPGYPESDFNPNVGDDDSDYVPETSTPEWQQQTQDQIFTPALNLPFDEMFPFCVIWDISKLMNKLYELGGYQAVSADQTTSLRGLYDKREGLQVQADEASRGGAQLNAWSKPAWTVGHTEFMLPLADFGIYGMYDLELDVWPLAVLLAWLKPFFQLAFIAGLLYVTIVTFRMFIFTD